jgi:hypothetical protein
VVWYGADYTFTATQAAAVSQLWQAWQNGTPDVGDQTILESIGSQARRLLDLFRDGNEMHPAWGTMIVDGGTKGAHRLSGQTGLG